LWIKDRYMGRDTQTLGGNIMPRVRVYITLPEECVEWIDEQVRRRIYATRSSRHRGPHTGEDEGREA
jgi:hypothetical protein